MNRLIALGITVFACVLVSGCAGSRRACQVGLGDDAVHNAHDAYVVAINSNNVETFLNMLTDDAVFMAPNTPRLVGKEAIRPWASGYLDAFEIRWEKTTLEFIVTGDWAIEQYAYASHDTPKDGGPAFNDTGKGINIYHREKDGQWRVARDAWNSDQPIGQ